MMLEIGMSMQNDAVDNRKGAFITRLRDYKECYFKGLWVGLMATPEQIVHDASGEKPWLMLAELAKRVCTTVYDEDSKLSVKHFYTSNRALPATPEPIVGPRGEENVRHGLEEPRDGSRASAIRL